MHNFSPDLDKCVGHSLKLLDIGHTIGHSFKNLGPSQKTLRPSRCSKLVTGLVRQVLIFVAPASLFPPCLYDLAELYVLLDEAPDYIGAHQIKHAHSFQFILFSLGNYIRGGLTYYKCLIR